MEVEVGSVDRRVNEAREKVQVVQTQLTMNIDTGLMEREKEVLADLHKWSDIQERILKQKSKAHWINAGDGNNKYFLHV